MGYLENKHRGGINNEKGSQYELNYATYQISNYLLLTNDHNIHIKTQIEGAYLDDLLITLDDIHKYYQIKNVKNLHWQSLENDFNSQFDKSTANKEKFELGLVYSDSDFSAEISDKLKSHTEFIYFPYTSTLYLLIDSYKPFKDSLIKLCTIKEPTNDLLYGIATAIIGVWCSIDKPKGTSMNYIADKLNNFKVNTILNADKEINNKCKYILNSIPNFSYEIKGNKLIWDYAHSKGNSTMWTPELETAIIENKPSTIKDIFKLL